MNAVAFYLLKGRLLVAFYEVQGTATTCVTFRNVEPDEIAVTLNEKLGFPFNAMCLVMSSRTEVSSPILRPKPEYGLGVSLYCEANTMPKASLRDFLPCVSCRRREIIENSKPFRKKPACR